MSATGASIVITPDTGLITDNQTDPEAVSPDGSINWKWAQFMIQWTDIDMGHAADEGDVYVQTFQEGVWFDIVAFHVDNAQNGGETFIRMGTIVVPELNVGNIIRTDGALADDTCLAGALLGTKYRTKYKETVGSAPAVRYIVTALLKQ
jgi:hypothetical protein